jgi:hypothetical protein
MRSVAFIISCALCASLVAPVSEAANPEFQISPRVGFGSLEVDQFVGVNDDLVDTDTVGLGVGFGYLTSPGIVLEVGIEDFGNLDFFGFEDRFSLFERYVAVGYQAELGRGWRLTPRVGYSDWELRSEESPLFNPGPEDEREATGDDVFWSLNLSRRVSRVLTLGLNYKRGNYDFGTASTTTFNFMFTFGGRNGPSNNASAR